MRGINPLIFSGGEHMAQSFLEIKEKLILLNSKTANYINEIKKLINEYEPLEKQINIISYFTYSLNISHDKQLESLLIGSYHIHNLGTKLLTNPIICIKISSPSTFLFSGKYVYERSKNVVQRKDAWKRINDHSNKEEYWLQPLSNSTIQANEVITFSNFQLKWLPKEAYATSIHGFTYTDEYKEGISAINPIYLNGS